MSAQIKSVIERILRMKEQQDELSADIRDIYAEAKSNGLDKTALGMVVSLIRKREKNALRYDELNAMAELYLAAYEGGTSIATRTHTHEISSGSLTADTSIPPRNQHGVSGPQPHAVTYPNAGGGSDEPPATHPETSTGGARQASDEHASVPSRPLAAAAPNTVAALSDAEALEHPTFLLRGHPDCPVRA